MSEKQHITFSAMNKLPGTGSCMEQMLRIKSLINKSTWLFNYSGSLTIMKCLTHINPPNTSTEWAPICFKGFLPRHVVLKMKKIKTAAYTDFNSDWPSAIIWYDGSESF